MKIPHELSPEELEFWNFFVSRKLMFVSDDSQKSIVNFVTGYEVGKDSVAISDAISLWIETNHGILKVNTGWPGQVAVLSERMEISWFETFALAVTGISL